MQRPKQEDVPQDDHLVEPMALTLDAALSPPSDEKVPVEVNYRIGRFVVLSKLGVGGMGAVFAAYDEQLDRKVALKLLHPGGSRPGEQRQRMVREAQALARVTHPHVIQVYDVGEVNGQIFIAMEYVAGMNLAAWQRERRDWREILRVYRQAGAGLLAAHETGLVHRDFKPDNVLLGKDGRARVVDFGLARLRADETAAPAAPVSLGGSGPQHALRTPLTADGAIAGTPGYMAPEQYRGQTVDSRTDQFSFCVAVYEALYGRLPFGGDTIAEVAANVLAGRVLPVPGDSTVPIEVRRALLRGLTVEPSARFPTMGELLEALSVEEERDPVGARPARRIISIVVATVVSICTILVSLRFTPRAFGAREMIGLAGLMLAMIQAAAVVFRKSALANAFHRGLLRRLQIGLGTILGVRCLGLVLRLDLAALLAIDAMVMAGALATIAYGSLPAAWWIAAGLVATSGATVIWPQHAFHIVDIAYLLTAIALIAVWTHASSERARSLPPSVK